ncbi:hypothetical protein BASA50_009837 [Batrachochytrium salamandrivorans]|uniref:Myb/SANT-like domain-containing protein n=1 Tax=Batrachochytrium salamandrivorans TaxID=1357716 RepID=A0ABQ8F079_9FUNG|nr:hypothetical protein BASA50_009837 [Batrachochytrium salamandrivorans]
MYFAKSKPGNSVISDWNKTCWDEFNKLFGLTHQYLAKSCSKHWNILVTLIQRVAFRFTGSKDVIKRSRPETP